MGSGLFFGGVGFWCAGWFALKLTQPPKAGSSAEILGKPQKHPGDTPAGHVSDRQNRVALRSHSLAMRAACASVAACADSA